MRINLLLLLFLALVCSCKEEITLTTRSNEIQMVVDGMITDEPGPYAVTLSVTSPLGQPEHIPLTGCTVTITDDAGYTEILAEHKDGQYLTHSEGIRGQPGREYQLSIQTPGGRHYETPFQKMSPPVKIDSLYSEVQYTERTDQPGSLPGLQFFTDSEKASAQENYFLWRITETFQYELDYKLYAIYYDGEILINNRDTISGYDSLYTCWKTHDAGTFFTGSTSSLKEAKIVKQPLHFVGTDTKRLSSRYSFLLHQYCIDRETYYYWKNLQEQITGDNFLLAKQPYNPTGNVRNTSDPQETVLGTFTVASVTTKRIFRSRPALPFYLDSCMVGTDLESMFKTMGPAFLVIGPQGMGKVHKDCIDCRSKGGVPRKPSFWTDY